MLRRGGVLCCVLRAASAVVRECRRFACKAEVLRQEIDENGVPCGAQVIPFVVARRQELARAAQMN